jgi:hypothetical protein
MTILDFEKIFSLEEEMAAMESSEDEWFDSAVSDDEISTIRVDESLETDETKPISMIDESVNNDNRLIAKNKIVEGSDLDLHDEKDDPDTISPKTASQLRKDSSLPTDLNRFAIMSTSSPIISDTANIPYCSTPNQPEYDNHLLELIMKLMKLRCQEEKLKAEISEVVSDIDNFFSKDSNERIRNGFSEIRKLEQETGKIQWIITIG